MWSFRPPRSPFGKWLDNNDISQQVVSLKSGVADATISNLASGKTKKPSRLTLRKLMKAIKEIDPSCRPGDFWDV